MYEKGQRHVTKNNELLEGDPRPELLTDRSKRIGRSEKEYRTARNGPGHFGKINKPLERNMFM